MGAFHTVYPLSASGEQLPRAPPPAYHKRVVNVLAFVCVTFLANCRVRSQVNPVKSFLSSSLIRMQKLVAFSRTLCRCVLVL